MATEPFSIKLAFSLATHLATNLLDATTRRVQRKFAADEQRQALDTALQEGLLAALETFPLVGIDHTHIQRLFEEYLARPEVIDELAQMIDPRPDIEINLTLLYEEFVAAGFDPDTLIHFEFETFIHRFLQKFYDSAAHQESLQGAIEIGLLRGLVEHTVDLLDTSKRTTIAVETLVDEFSPFAEQILAGNARANELRAATHNAIQQGFAQIYKLFETLISVLHQAGYDVKIEATETVIIGDIPQVNAPLDSSTLKQLQTEITRLRSAIVGSEPTKAEMEVLETRYRQHIIRWFDRLTFQGMMRTAQAISLPLEEVFVELRAVAEVPEAADTFSVEERRLLLELKEGDETAKQELLRQFDALRRERWSRASLERKSILEALYDRDQRAFVILGDPGSGKTTLLHLLALVFARGPEVAEERLRIPRNEANRIPIFIPLAAFDDMLRENPGLTLFEFLGRYYDQRRGLPGLTPLFRQALESGRALILLDGLDEVLETTTRQYVSSQAAAMIGDWSPRGSRFVLTSRFVGYREAPVGSGLPHLSVLDFGEDEIKTFVHQWARTYEVWAAGGQETPESFQKARQAEKDLLADVNSIPSVRRLASNPLMLTMLALLRRQVGRLPHRRIELYKRYMDTMVENWIEARSHGERAHSIDLLDPHQAESILIPLAYWLQSTHPSGTASITEIQNTLTESYLPT